MGTLHWVQAQQLAPLRGGGRVRLLVIDPPLPMSRAARTAP